MLGNVPLSGRVSGGTGVGGHCASVRGSTVTLFGAYIDPRFFLVFLSGLFSPIARDRPCMSIRDGCSRSGVGGEKAANAEEVKLSFGACALG
jgi:hypothetical protein